MKTHLDLGDEMVKFVLRPYFFPVTHEILNKSEVLYIQHVIANEM